MASLPWRLCGAPKKGSRNVGGKDKREGGICISQPRVGGTCGQEAGEKPTTQLEGRLEILRGDNSFKLVLSWEKIIICATQT